MTRWSVGMTRVALSLIPLVAPPMRVRKTPPIMIPLIIAVIQRASIPKDTPDDSTPSNNTPDDSTPGNNTPGDSTLVTILRVTPPK